MNQKYKICMCILLFFLLLYIFKSNNLVEGQLSENKGKDDNEEDKKGSNSNKNPDLNTGSTISLCDASSDILNTNSTRFGLPNVSGTGGNKQLQTLQDTCSKSVDTLKAYLKTKVDTDDTDKCSYQAKYLLKNDTVFKENIAKYVQDCYAFKTKNSNIKVATDKQLNTCPDDLKMKIIRNACFTASNDAYKNQYDNDKKCGVKNKCDTFTQNVNNDTSCHFNYNRNVNKEDYDNLQNNTFNYCIYNDYGDDNNNDSNVTKAGRYSPESLSTAIKQTCCIDKQKCSEIKYEDENYYIYDNDKYTKNYCSSAACDVDNDANNCGLEEKKQCKNISEFLREGTNTGNYKVKSNKYFKDKNDNFYKINTGSDGYFNPTVDIGDSNNPDSYLKECLNGDNGYKNTVLKLVEDKGTLRNNGLSNIQINSSMDDIPCKNPDCNDIPNLQNYYKKLGQCSILNANSSIAGKYVVNKNGPNKAYCQGTVCVPNDYESNEYCGVKFKQAANCHDVFSDNVADSTNNNKPYRMGTQVNSLDKVYEKYTGYNSCNDQNMRKCAHACGLRKNYKFNKDNLDEINSLFSNFSTSGQYKTLFSQSDPEYTIGQYIDLDKNDKYCNSGTPERCSFDDLKNILKPNAECSSLQSTPYPSKYSQTRTQNTYCSSGICKETDMNRCYVPNANCRTLQYEDVNSGKYASVYNGGTDTIYCNGTECSPNDAEKCFESRKNCKEDYTDTPPNDKILNSNLCSKDNVCGNECLSKKANCTQFLKNNPRNRYEFNNENSNKFCAGTQCSIDSPADISTCYTEGTSCSNSSVTDKGDGFKNKTNYYWHDDQDVCFSKLDKCTADNITFDNTKEYIDTSKFCEGTACDKENDVRSCVVSKGQCSKDSFTNTLKDKIFADGVYDKYTDLDQLYKSQKEYCNKDKCTIGECSSESQWPKYVSGFENKDFKSDEYLNISSILNEKIN